MGALQTIFDPTSYDNPMGASTRLRQTSTVVVCKAQFESLSNSLKGLFEKHKLIFCLSKLRDEISSYNFNPTSLNTTFGLGKIQEEYILSNRMTMKPLIEQGAGLPFRPAKD